MSVNGSSVSSTCCKNFGTSMSAAPIPQTWVCSQCSHPAMIVFCWQCIQQN